MERTVVIVMVALMMMMVVMVVPARPRFCRCRNQQREVASGPGQMSDAVRYWRHVGSVRVFQRAFLVDGLDRRCCDDDGCDCHGRRFGHGCWDDDDAGYCYCFLVGLGFGFGFGFVVVRMMMKMRMGRSGRRREKDKIGSNDYVR